MGSRASVCGSLLLSLKHAAVVVDGSCESSRPGERVLVCLKHLRSKILFVFGTLEREATSLKIERPIHFVVRVTEVHESFHKLYQATPAVGKKKRGGGEGA